MDTALRPHASLPPAAPIIARLRGLGTLGGGRKEYRRQLEQEYG